METKDCCTDNWPKQIAILDDADRRILENQISYMEILDVIKGLGNNKSPGPDGKMCSNWKETLIVLIPKISNPLSPEGFRPINLCNSIYKVVDKVLLNRLLMVIPKVILEEQVAFLKGRSISDQLLLAQELVNKIRISKSKEGLVAIKLDMEQAYDSMSWNTLEEMMRRLGFLVRFMKLIMECIVEPRFSIIINGGLSKWIERRSGFRQGCPLSPFLFIICPQLLTNVLSQEGKELGIKVASRGKKISHLLYVDDVLLLSDAKIKSIKELKIILSNCYGWTRQKLNLKKSAMIISKNVERRRKKKIARILNIKGLHYVAWEDLCKPRASGGWGIHSAISSIQTLRAKFSWNLIINPDSLLNRNLVIKYGEDWWKKDVIKGGSSAWKIISSGWKSLRNISRWNVVKGSHIDVLKDVWIFYKSLLKWPTFAAPFEQDNITLDYFILEGRLNIDKLLLYFSEDLVNVISNIQIHQEEEEDFMDLKYKFSGKTIAALIKEEKVRMDEGNSYLWIHKMKLYARVELFTWRLCKKAIPTANFLMKWRISNNNMCPRGCGEVEDLDHVTTKCPKLVRIICTLRDWGFHIPFFESFQQYFWHPPPPEWYKINIDAALRSNYGAGIGGIVRDHKGRFVHAFGLYGMHWDIAQLELYSFNSLKDLLNNCLDNAKGVIIEEDNKNVIQFLLNMYSK
ncbi:uncharacterized protein LOC110094507 [Dendrobium catenatum]|uniref:uncharacterized protein LOC110094507 n=1 Tax=Dendrobium catenatum TaxID=906689 RepID=UPI0009F7167D|nr:uncharacterized protein LOC110094507 [Dendrobium catenatum]